VRTYIQSGNVTFESADEPANLLCSKIENELLEKEKVYISFLSKEPTAEAINKLISVENEIDDFQILNREVYILCRKNYGKSLYSNTFLEKKLGVSATTRNWDTLNKLVNLGRS
jgi:uncharacterized protein (DUF1697 family)